MEGTGRRADIFRYDQLVPEDCALICDAWELANQNRELLASLEPHVLTAVVELGDNYLRTGQYTQLRKLFKNAVVYVAEGKISHAPGGGFFVEGNTNDHHVTVANDHSMGCDCDLFNGRSQFEGNAGECSHIQTATLFMLAERSIHEA